MKNYYRESQLTRDLKRYQRKNPETGHQGVPGLYTGEPDFLVKMAKMAPDGPSVEVGIRYGMTMLLWAPFRLPGPIIGIDMVDREIMRENLRSASCLARVIIGDSATVPLPVAEIAFLFLDGDHRKRGHKADMRRYLPMIIPGGVVVFHDYGHDKKRYPEFAVTEQVRKWARKAKWIRMGKVRHCIAFQRPLCE